MNLKSLLFIAASALLHLVVIALLRSETTLIKFTEQGRSGINVTLNRSTNQQSETKTRQENLKFQPDRSTPDAAIKQRSTKSYTSPPVPTESVARHDSTQVSVTKDIADEKESDDTLKDTLAENSQIKNEKINSIIRTEFSKFFYYPRSAQRKSWQGLVILSFIIMPDGHINNISVSQSSGYKTLDDAAINALEKVRKQHELSIALNGSQLQHSLPVNYILTN